MKITIIGAGNSGLAMAAHLGQDGHQVTLWNRSNATIEKLKTTRTIFSEGVVTGSIQIHLVTNNMAQALHDPDLILVTTPASSHKEIAEQIAKNLKKETLIVLNPGRTFGAFEFQETYRKYNPKQNITLAETQTIIYICRKTSEDAVNIIAMKNDVLIATFSAEQNAQIIQKLPTCLQPYLTPAHSMIETSIGNVGMILHCAPLLLNVGWTENDQRTYKYYTEGITPSIAHFIEQLDQERLAVAKALGCPVEKTKDWLKRTYHVTGSNLYECIQNNSSYQTIMAPTSLNHRYLFEDIPCGLVPLEAVGIYLGLPMPYTKNIIDLATLLMNTDYRKNGRNLTTLFGSEAINLKALFS